MRLGIVFQWSFNDEIIANETSENFTLNDITPSEDGGYYECLVSNPAGSGLYSTTLYFSPVITVHPVDIRTVNGSLNVMLNCTATAYPTPQYEWVKQAGPLPNCSNVTSNGDSSILTISTVVFGDEGYYSCIASSNNISTESYEATLYGKSSKITIDQCMQVYYYYFFSFPIGQCRGVAWRCSLQSGRFCGSGMHF